MPTTTRDPNDITAVASPVLEQPKSAAPQRITSVDVYRGFVMLLMMAEVLEFGRIAKAVPESTLWQYMTFNQDHVPWVGCSLHDLIQPSFSFLGQVNLSPFSFFNLFSVNPAVVVFSPSRRLRDNTTKHTLENVLEVPEVVINMVDEAMVHQTSLASCEYDRDTNEFTKAGFTMQPATVVSPPMVHEAKLKLECRVLEVKSLGENSGAGQLVIAEVLCMHVDESILSNEGKIDPLAFHLVARLGGDWYCRVNADNLFQVPKPNTQLGIGIDALPTAIKNSTILTGNHLGQLANVHQMPVINPAFHDDKLKNIFQYFSLSPDDMEKELHLYAKELLSQNKVYEAWQVLLTTG